MAEPGGSEALEVAIAIECNEQLPERNEQLPERKEVLDLEV